MENSWIPVTKKLPDEYTKTPGYGYCVVLASRLISGYRRQVVQCFFVKGKFFIRDTKYPVDDVVAWKPLPEPYTESNAE